MVQAIKMGKIEDIRSLLEQSPALAHFYVNEGNARKSTFFLAIESARISDRDPNEALAVVKLLVEAGAIVEKYALDMLVFETNSTRSQLFNDYLAKKPVDAVIIDSKNASKSERILNSEEYLIFLDSLHYEDLDDNPCCY